jgi:hygromycin-B 7''-O-kinase
LQLIINRHQLPSAPASRFPDGMNPVFAVGRECVVKFIPPFRTLVATREIEVLTHLVAYPQVPVARLIAHGRIEDWHYVVTSRIEGEPLHRVWPALGPETRLQLAADYGRLFATLHAVPTGDLRPGGIVWPDFCRTSISRWTERHDFVRLPPRLQVDGLRYLAQHGSELISTSRVLLHGDLAPENLLVQRTAHSWEVAGMIDFGNAMCGAASFDLTAASVMLQPGDRTMVRTLIEHSASGDGPLLSILRPILMSATMIHPMSDLPECLGLVSEAEKCITWDDVALKFWPE